MRCVFLSSCSGLNSILSVFLELVVLSYVVNLNTEERRCESCEGTAWTYERLRASIYMKLMPFILMRYKAHLNPYLNKLHLKTSSMCIVD